MLRRLLLLGAPGVGKGTQAARLVARLGVPQISTGDMLRAAVAAGTAVGREARGYMDRGELVPDAVVIAVAEERLRQPDTERGFILDGFPRNSAQAEFFLESYELNAVIHVHVPDAVVRQRILSRRLCEGCGLDYNLIHHRPMSEDTCDVCGGRLVARADDNEQALDARLRDYHAKTEPVLDLFRRRIPVVEVDGTRDAAEVQAAIRDKLHLPPRRGAASGG